MLDVAGVQEFSGGDGLDGFAHQNAVHDDLVADLKVLRSELVLGWHALWQLVMLTVEGDCLADTQVCQGDQDIVARIELEDVGVHRV